jgi:hypothetical protein
MINYTKLVEGNTESLMKGENYKKRNKTFYNFPNFLKFILLVEQFFGMW